MEVALITVGDELPAGDTENTNATWLARRLTERGVAVERILVLPDDRGAIARQVREYSDAFDAVLVTGGIGGAPDDVSMEAVSALAAAAEWLLDNISASETPVERDWDPENATATEDS